ncbi:MAG: hypothetical protein CK535_03310 [Pelagibacteraceae bacterium]|nr:MAG: hypothetical protein CK535_03310 [Pelagibacteraceae bacterium]
MKRIFLILFISNLFLNNLYAMSESYQKKFYNGCYPESIHYLGSIKANEYCSCTIKKLSKKYSDEDIDKISRQSEEIQVESFSFASDFCAKLVD